MPDYTLENIKTLDRGVNKLMAGIDQAHKEYEDIATVVTSKARVTSYAWLGDLPKMEEWTDERQKAALEDYKYDIEKKDWETSFYVTRDDFIFDGLGIVNTKVQTLMHAVTGHYNEIVAGLITENGKCFDGKAFFGTHKIGDENHTNKSKFKFTKDNVFKVLAIMKSIKKTNGSSMGIKPNLVLIAPDLEQDALSVLKATVLGGSTNEAHNLLDYKVMDNMDEGTWCVLDTTRPVKPFILQITKEAKKIDRLTQNPLVGKKIYYGVDTMDNAGYSFWQLAHFCDGTETAATGA